MNRSDLPRRVSPTAECLTQPFGEGIVLLQTERGVYYELEEVGARFWTLLAEAVDMDAVFATMLVEFDIDEPTLAADLARLITELADAGLVVLE